MPWSAEASQPEDWDAEEDGEWEPPRVSNPKCKEGPGCGEWKRPMTPNPAYKGKWTAPLIDNSEYKVRPRFSVCSLHSAPGQKDASAAEWTMQM